MPSICLCRFLSSSFWPVSFCPLSEQSSSNKFQPVKNGWFLTSSFLEICLLGYTTTRRVLILRRAKTLSRYILVVPRSRASVSRRANLVASPASRGNYSGGFQCVAGLGCACCRVRTCLLAFRRRWRNKVAGGLPAVGCAMRRRPESETGT